MREKFYFLIMLAGLYAGVCLIFISYAQWLAYLLEFFSNPSAGTALKSLFWLFYSAGATYLTGEIVD